MATAVDLEIIYYFAGPSRCVFEAKIIGLAESAPPAEVFHWLCLDLATERLEKLRFESMGSERGRHFRLFEQGELWFDGATAELSFATGSSPRESAMVVMEPTSFPAELYSRVRRFLRG